MKQTCCLFWATDMQTAAQRCLVGAQRCLASCAADMQPHRRLTAAPACGELSAEHHTHAEVSTRGSPIACAQVQLEKLLFAFNISTTCSAPGQVKLYNLRSAYTVCCTVMHRAAAP